MKEEILHVSSGLWDARTACGKDAFDVTWPSGEHKPTCKDCRDITRAQEREDLHEAINMISEEVGCEKIWKKDHKNMASYIINRIKTTKYILKGLIKNEQY